ncbi:MAG: anthranilate phosphoribosyltransferase, partial [Actinomycetota bacterium]|nr:anthranilate phosphoribosyltransferase [Actinomycetota bacterium]
MADGDLTAAIDALASGRDLAQEQAAAVLAQIMAGEASETQIAAFLIALRTKGETAQELAGLAETMRALATRVTVARDDLLDTAGTGGGRPTFN